MAPEEVENNVQFAAEQKSSVKVTRNSKGYTWEIKVYDNDPNKALEKNIELELKCVALYGTKQE